jgi:hypothetical protein
MQGIFVSPVISSEMMYIGVVDMRYVMISKTVIPILELNQEIHVKY